MNSVLIKFGTDGWRAVIAKDYTFENLKILSQAVADYVGKGKRVVIGYDSRFMSDKFAEVCADILANNEIEVVISDKYIPTPTLSFTTRFKNFDLGIMITASHNPYYYNGFKIKLPTGSAAGPEVTSQIEALIGKSKIKENNPNKQKIILKDFLKDYIRFIREYIDLKRIKQRRLKILLDTMYGSTDRIFEEILRGTKISVEFIRADFNPSFDKGSPEPIEENLKELKLRMKKGKFDIGLALDGDGDRIACFAPGGIFIHPQKILGLLALHLNQDRHFSGGIVKTIAGTTLIDKIAKFLNVKLYETPVGFKYISSLMEKEDILVGGEEAGGMGVKNYIPERDGTMAGLLLIEMMVYRNKNILRILREMEQQFGKYYYLREDLRLKERKEINKNKLPKELLGKKVVQIKDFDGFKLIAEDESWLMFRSSGTEPIMRVYAESKNLKRTKELLNFGKDLILSNALSDS